MRGAYSRSRLSVSYHRNIVAYNMHCDGYSLINNKFVQWTSVPLTENPQRFVSFINCWFSFEKNPTSAIIFDLIQQCFVLDFVESIVIYNVWQLTTKQKQSNLISNSLGVWFLFYSFYNCISKIWSLCLTIIIQRWSTSEKCWFGVRLDIMCSLK